MACPEPDLALSSRPWIGFRKLFLCGLGVEAVILLRVLGDLGGKAYLFLCGLGVLGGEALGDGSPSPVMLVT